MGQFATTFFRTIQHCNVGTMLQPFESTMLQRFVLPKILVGNRPVQHHLYSRSQLLIPIKWINKMKFCLSLFQSNHNNGDHDVGKFRHDYT